MIKKFFIIIFVFPIVTVAMLAVGIVIFESEIGPSYAVISMVAGFFAAWWFAADRKNGKLAQHSDPDKPKLSDINALDAIEPVHGVWEYVTYQWQAGNYLCFDDCLKASRVYVTPTTVYHFSRETQTWDAALNADLPPDTPMRNEVAISDIQSIEMESYGKFVGEEPRENRVKPALGKKAFLRQRHPSLSYSGGFFWDSNTRSSVVYIFTKEGDRIRLFRTWDRDKAIKWRTQIANRIEATRQAKAPDATPEQGQADYL